MKIQSRAFYLLLFLSTSLIPMHAQRGLDQPPAKTEVENHQLVLEPPVGPRAVKVNLAGLHQDALDLAQLAQSIPADVNQAAQGKLAKDLAEKLKKIEKLSKHLRTELTR